MELTGPLTIRQEKVFFCLSAVFLGAMTLLNVIGITRFVQIGPMALAVGVLPYPLTFLCTDLISEIYGRARANFVVWVGLGLNFFIFGSLYLANALPSVPASLQPSWQTLKLSEPVTLTTGRMVEGQVELFELIFACSSGAIFASMLAYMAAQFCDVWLYHFWKKLTKGKHLWLRNNFSTLLSQIVDTFAVISITFGSLWWQGELTSQTLFMLMGSNYLFKMFAALLDTLPLYGAVHFLRQYLNPE